MNAPLGGFNEASAISPRNQDFADLDSQIKALLQ